MALPPALADYAGAEAVWLNEAGGITFDAGARFVKWNPLGTGIDLQDEIMRLDWVRSWHPVPRIIEVGADATGEWLVTEAIAANSAVSGRWSADVAAREMGVGLRLLHESAPVDDCPFDWSAESRGGLEVPPIDRLVVCHGDPCAPNFLLGAAQADEGRFAASVDLGSLGVADRWADLAVASMSLGWNFGAGHEGAFFAGYGIEPDAGRIRYYRNLWNSEDEGRALKLEA